MNKILRCVPAILMVLAAAVCAQDSVTILRPAQVFDGEDMQRGRVVLVQGNSANEISNPRKVRLVMKDGVIYRQ